MRLAAAISTVVVALALAASAPAGTPPLVPKGDILALDTSFHPLVLDAHGKIVRRLPSWHIRDGFFVFGTELARDRNHAFVSLWSRARSLPARLYEVSLATGSRRFVADGLSPSLSPDGTRLAYFSDRYERGGVPVWVGGLVVRTLATGRERTIPFDGAEGMTVAFEFLTNWSPDDRTVAIAPQELHVVDTTTAKEIEDVPTLGPTPVAAVFLNAGRLIVETNCCSGRQKLATVDASGAHPRAFAEIPSPVIAIRRFGTGRMLVLDWHNELHLVSHGRTTTIAKGILAATG